MCPGCFRGLMRPVVPFYSLLPIALLFAVAVLPVPGAVACDQRDCYNEVYTAGGASVVGIDVQPPFVCAVEPCGNGGIGVNGGRTESHGTWTYVHASIVDWVYGNRAPIGLCAEAVPGECVETAEVDCGANSIWATETPFHNVTYFIPHIAVLPTFEVCRASAGLVTAVFSDTTTV